MKKLQLIFLLLALSCAALSQNRYITRGAEEGELYLTATWYGIYGAWGPPYYSTLRIAILRFTENGRKAEIVYDEDYFAHDHNTSIMAPANIIADATPGVLYNHDRYMDEEWFDRDRLWVSFDYGKTWELRDEPIYPSYYFASNMKGIIYRGGEECIRALIMLRTFLKRI